MATSKKPVAAIGDGTAQTIEQLQQRYEQLNKQKIQAETKLEAATKTLEALKREAREKYGTDDVAELRTKLDAIKAENEQKRAQYQTDLDKIESDLGAVEQRFAVAENPAAKGGA